MAEWMNAPVLKTGEPFGVPGVQIPLSVLYIMPLLPNGKASASKADKPKGCAGSSLVGGVYAELL